MTITGCAQIVVFLVVLLTDIHPRHDPVQHRVERANATGPSRPRQDLAEGC